MEASKEKRKLWYDKNREKMKAYQRSWAASHRTKMNKYQRTYRAKQKILARFGYKIWEVNNGEHNE